MVQHTASWYYKNDETVMSEVRKTNPEMSSKDLKTLLGQQWKGLTPDQKAPYERMVIVSKEEKLDLEYDEIPPNIENLDSNKTIEEDEILDQGNLEEEVPTSSSSSSSSSSMSSNPNSEETGKPLPEGKKYKQPKSSFMHFLYDPLVREEHPNFSGKELTKHLSTLWNQMSQEEKKPWVEKHQNEKDDLKKNPILIDKKMSKKTEHKESDPLDGIAQTLKEITSQLLEIQTRINEFKQT